jgi:hypothetical protein
MLGKWRRFLQLTAAERDIVFWALVFVPLTRMALRIFGYCHWQDLLFLAVPNVSGAEVRPELIIEARRAARLIRTAATEGLAKGRCPRTIRRVVMGRSDDGATPANYASASATPWVVSKRMRGRRSDQPS